MLIESAGKYDVARAIEVRPVVAAPALLPHAA